MQEHMCVQQTMSWNHRFHSWSQVREVPEKLNGNSFHLFNFFFSSVERLPDKCPYRIWKETCDLIKGQHSKSRRVIFSVLTRQE